jgi:GNAT superfamily N-acetyltransferase
MLTTIRPFEEHNLPGVVAVGNRVFPELQQSEAEAAHEYQRWEKERFHLYRVVAIAGAGAIMGWGQVHHPPDQFHPDTYYLDLQVDPPVRRQGIGRSLFDHLLTHLGTRAALLVRAETKGSLPEAIAFLQARGFGGVQRGWESWLDVAQFDPTRFAGVAELVAAQSMVITTLAEELAGNPDAISAAYELYLIGNRDAPEIDPVSDLSLDYFVDTLIDATNARLDGYFVAKDGDRFVAQAMVLGSEAEPDVLVQDLTAVVPAYRGRGIGLALKLRTVDFARDHGIREIPTWNNTRNQPMLRINEAMGFVKQPVWIVYQKELATDCGR